ncbi:MAG: hypothetical protein IKZ12_02060 [Alistipes sp.]|nr:hypothetical protein [Alistipes sp.]
MSKPIYTLEQVITPRQEQWWIDYPKEHYKAYPHWICPLDNDLREVFDPTRNELFADGEAVRWIARDGAGRIVGRIAAFYSRSKASIEEQPTGGCGFFESIDEQEVANLLFDAARDWLAARGMEAMDGPINFGQRSDWWGVLVDGFDYEPLYKNPYNPPYYQRLFEQYGFQNYFNQNSYIWTLGESEASERLKSRAERLYALGEGYRVEQIDLKHLEEAAEQFRTVYNKAWAMFTGVKPIEREEAQALLRQMKPIIDPRIIIFAYKHDEPIGFFVSIPDLNRIIGRFGGKFGIWQKVRLLWELKVRKSCDRIFGLIFGIAPEAQGKGVESAIMYKYQQFMESAANRYKSLEMAWIGDFNPVMNRMITTYVGASRHKMHTTYRYLFDREKEFKRCPRLGLKRKEN